MLAGAAIAAEKDPLYGLKENVIIGKLIPAGTGFSDKRINRIAEIAGELEQQTEEVTPDDEAIAEKVSTEVPDEPETVTE